MTDRLAEVLSIADPSSVERTAAAILDGSVVAIPTDTVYGVAASLERPEALARVFDAKGRDRRKVLPVLVASTAHVERLTTDLHPDIPELLDAYWPGPLTVVVTAMPGLPAEVRGSDGTVGLRMPSHSTAIAVIERAGGAVACTSANLSGSLPARTAADVVASLGASLDLILDGGPTPGGTPSTVIRAVGGRITLLREGAIPIAHVRRTWREILGRGRD